MLRRPRRRARDAPDNEATRPETNLILPVPFSTDAISQSRFW
jgi:hypothetical protein